MMLTRRDRVTVVLTWVFTSVNFKGAVVSSPPILTVTNVKCDTIIAGALVSTRSAHAFVDVGFTVISLEPTSSTFTVVRIHVFGTNAAVFTGRTATFVIVYIAVIARVARRTSTVIRVRGIKSSCTRTSMLAGGRIALVDVNPAI